ncbi:hypothetical protein SAMN04515679_0522 [Pelosinus fermentans]|uniref:Uncharacterized protein n=1 Tax=Pelosinus fermentans JBW45 TaxID=1192197 RepID=I9DA14_9FIRM|nr:hypothetical protein [Pelosinus fermentans]AJQ25675.1 hypothetical protein JBW_00323 [Pelosinus fermentans JBW45]OAM92453.1 hypothetical protein FR7_00469 [Pelosinus fermentans DSM 17108]SDQ45392.1 hypothetical protein SAMN04515679_0522 [Pelosinus fermentans]
MGEYVVGILIAGGIYNILLAVFHIMFWRMDKFNWKEELPKMSSINMAVIQLLNVAVIVFFFLISYISIFHTRELLSSGLGKTVLLGVSLFWLIRLGGEFTFKKGTPANPVLVVILVIGALLYLIPALSVTA